MTDIDLCKLEALADAASGEWLYTESGRPEYRNVTFYVETNPPGEGPFVAEVDKESNAAFIAAANPATIKSLIASAREAAAEIEDARSLIAESIGLVTEGYDDADRFVKKGRAFLARAAQMDGEG